VEIVVGFLMCTKQDPGRQVPEKLESQQVEEELRVLTLTIQMLLGVRKATSLVLL